MPGFKPSTSWYDHKASALPLRYNYGSTKLTFVFSGGPVGMVDDDQLDEELDDVGFDVPVFAAERQDRRRHPIAELANLQAVIGRQLQRPKWSRQTKMFQKTFCFAIFVAVFCFDTQSTFCPRRFLFNPVIVHGSTAEVNFNIPILFSFLGELKQSNFIRAQDN